MEKRTPGRPVQNKLLEKTAQNKYHTLGSDSPFRFLPIVSTPPSSLLKIRNPFESQLTERLHHPVFSPSVFSIQSTKTEDKFKWTIEEISTLKPADIDERTVDLFEANDHDPETEVTVQAKIESYFNEKHIVPSPFNVVCPKPLISECPEKKFKQLVEGEAQTILTLPPTLPDHVEAVLKPFFSYTVDQQQDQESRSSLYRRLFELSDSNSANNSALTSPAPSCVISPIELSPYDEGTNSQQRIFGSPQDRNRMPECNLSPIASNSDALFERALAGSSLNFSSRMSVDTSLNFVPDTLDQLPSNNQSLVFESMHSPIPELLSNSAVNWDLEYKHISLASSSGDEMDVSNSNTPKSKIFISQRKKLSDSFLRVEDCDEDKENVFNLNYFQPRNTKGSSLYSQSENTIDFGYHTGSGLTMSEESYNSPQLYASTPTKK